MLEKKTKYSQKNYESDDSLKIINKWHSTLKGKIQYNILIYICMCNLLMCITNCTIQ